MGKLPTVCGREARSKGIPRRRKGMHKGMEGKVLFKNDNLMSLKHRSLPKEFALNKKNNKTAEVHFTKERIA